MLGRDVFVLGVGMSRFGAPGLSLGDRAFEAGIEALEDGAVEFTDVGCVYLGTCLAPPTFGVRVVKDLGLTGVPVQRVENASATGGAAFFEAVHAVASGRVEIALALGFDDPGTTRFNEWQPGVMPLTEAVVTPAAFFAFWAVRRMHDRGTTAETLAAIAAKNWNHAALNPKAERQPEAEVTVERVLASRMIAYPHTTRMAAPMGAGAAAAIVGSRDALARLGNGRRPVRVAAAQAHSERYVDGHLFAGAVVGPPEMARRASFAAYEEAGLGPEDLDTVQVHDAYAIEELLYYEEIGLCDEGEGDRLVHDGDTKLGGRIPVSTDGGFIGRGHPAGPTGLAQIWELTHQVRGTAGPRQVDGARVALAHIVGAGSVCFAHILVDGSTA
ncbi:MAG: thiolase family protein [Solirubrobacteraceae bacterium]